MGSRAHYVIIEDGRHRNLYSQWGAHEIDLDLLPGPGSALRFARAQHPVEAWTDAEMCDGAALFDLDTRTLLWFGHCGGDPAVRAAALATLHRTWPGWTVEWAYNGLMDVAARVGTDPAAIRTPRAMPVADDLRTPEDFHAAFPQMRLNPETYPPGSLLPRELPLGPIGLREAPPDQPWDSILLTVRRDGRVSAYDVDGTPAIIAENGAERVFEYVSSWTPVTRLPRVPAAGVHLDADARRAGVWTSYMDLLGEPSMSAALWPSWRWELWQDRPHEQLERCDGAVEVPAPDLCAGFDRLSERFAEHQEGGSALEGISMLLSVVGGLRAAAEEQGAELRSDTGAAMLHRPIDLEEHERKAAEAAIEEVRP